MILHVTEHPDESIGASHGAPMGYCGFDHSADIYETMQRQLQQADITVFSLKTSQLLKNKITLTDSSQHCIIFQDLPLPQLLPCLESLLNLFIAPCRMRQIPVSFISKQPRSEYDLPVSSANLHLDLNEIWQRLLLEQLLNLQSDEGAAPVPSSETRQTYSLDDDLDDSQLQAISYRDGPIRVLAPAGSGKTKTLTNRIIQLINLGIKPETILALAFNKKAADEMIQRLVVRGIPVAKRLHQPGAVVRTFHGLGYEIIRRELAWFFDGETEQERLRALLQQAVQRHFKLQQRRNQDPLDPFLTAVNLCKMDLAPVRDLTVETEEESVPFAPIFDELLHLQIRKKFCTFDDMIYFAVRLLLDRPALRRKMQKHFQYLLIDEFQDLNRAQLMMMQILSLPQNNLFVVGDDDQMIYGWRGADIRHILEFPKQYAGAADCTLSTNYRSTKAIVQHSKWLIQYNKRRVKKNISAAEGAGPGKIDIRLSNSLWQQAQDVTDWIGKLQKNGKNRWEDFAVLFRYHAYKYVTALLLDTAGIPHTPVDDRSLAQTAVGRDIFAYLTIILFPENASEEELTRVLKRPNKYFTNHFIHSIQSWQDLQIAPKRQGIEEWMVINLQDFLTDIQFLQEQSKRNRSASKLLSTVAAVFNFREFYDTQIKRYAPLDEAGLNVLLDVFITVAQAFPTIEEFYQYLKQSLAALPGTKPVTVQTPGINLSTIHASKGKEFKYVALFNMSELQKFEDEDLNEEERRVAYVGLTRGSESVIITSSSKAPSRFLFELALKPQYHNFTDSQLLHSLKRHNKELDTLQKNRDFLKQKLQKMQSDYIPSQNLSARKPATQKVPKREKEIIKIENEIKSVEKTKLPALSQEIAELEKELFFRKMLFRREVTKDTNRKENQHSYF